jgi:hypothetical protein
MDTFFSALLWLSVIALIVALGLSFRETYGKGRGDIFNAD